ncbi:DUF2285 domain-containing protein [Microbulbifer sp. CAU 1566]|uniref:DNA -binding domain-containing protein n=1 Tax=Microbulbifer sp. CAU 1566 TaxID=2933269 RepID=UPI002002ADCA|nr:DUF2285 domain-containing protein [Microbulbifer sp. CAU 1566]MCK7597785.1 DUF2285 domain-containing protein [Microbulbifer sp. CAU 1566]
MKAYPIKNFRDPSAYPSWKGINAWRWEFLRRNPEYQAFFDANKTKFKTDPSNVSCWRFGVRSLHDPAHDEAYQGMLPPSRVVGLPTFDDLERWEKVPGYTPEMGLTIILRILTELQYQGDTLAVIDRSLPVKPQLTAIGEAVELRNSADGVSPAFQRQTSTKWPEYLRVLDGKAAGASDDEIAAVLYPDKENNYPDYPVRKRVEKAAAQGIYLSKVFATKGFSPEK